ncbi:MAG: hypothetical protein IT258_14055 [Saprospiraceae bacterium]|nr:hypothetical protein [Saprospiraceae bacterium]
MKWITCLLLFLFLPTQSFSQAQDSVPAMRKYPIVYLRSKMWLREYGIYLSPFVKHLPWLSVGVGYRKKSFWAERGLSCAYAEHGLLKAKMHGPFVSLGFDSHNLRKKRDINHSAVVGYRWLDAGRVDYTDGGCFNGSGRYTVLKIYDASAKELFFKWVLDATNDKRRLEVFFSLGGGFRWTRKAFSKRGFYESIYIDNDIEEVLYFIPQWDTGFRFNLFNIKRRG